MTNFIYSGERNTPIQISKQNDTYTLTSTLELTVQDVPAVVLSSDASNNVVSISGSVASTSQRETILVVGDNNKITINEDGEVKGTSAAFAVSGDLTSVENSGLISGKFGLLLSGNEILVNNVGKIVADKTAVTAADHVDGLQLNNIGIIKGDGKYAIALGDGDDVIYNGGIIRGNVDLGDGANRFDFSGGQVKGKVFGGMDNDTYVIWHEDNAIAEQKGGGVDAVYSSISYSLGKNVENLSLVGTFDVAGTGNGKANLLTGNLGDNVLRGMGGSDYLIGQAGDDLMSGGRGADVFVFKSTNDGRDIITDFDVKGPDRDLVDLSVVVDGSFPFELSDHLSQNGAHAVFVLEDTKIIFRNVDADDLAKSLMFDL